MQLVPISYASHIRSNSLTPYYVQTRCLATSSTAYSPSPNDVNALAEVTNNCPATTTLFLGMYVQANCIGKGASGSTGWNLRLYSGSVGDEPQNWGIGCVVCKNGKPIGYPPFSVSVQVQANGTFIFHSILYKTDSNTATDTTNVANDGFYSPGC